jgi:hypothetical protein
MSEFEMGRKCGREEALGLLRTGCVSNDDVRQKAVWARAFMLSHPALGDHFDSRVWWWSVQKVCKRGISEESAGHMSLSYDAPGSDRFKAEFEEEYKDDLGMLKDHPFMCTINKTYEEIYGEPWVYDHVEYWWEMSFMVYQGGMERDSKDWMSTEKWGAYGFEMGSAPTYEECLVNAAELVRKHLGDFKEYDFETAEEKANHEGKMPFLFVPSDHIFHNKITGRAEACSEMKDNPEYIDVHSGMLNRRWLEWFVKTDYCREKWGTDLDGIAAGQPVTY